MEPTPQHNTQPGPVQKHTQKAVFGPLALLVFGGAVLLIILIVLAIQCFPPGYPGVMLHVALAIIVGAASRWFRNLGPATRQSAEVGQAYSTDPGAAVMWASM